MKKILFVIHNMEEGGAQKVLVNLVNNLDKAKFDVSVTAIFGGGINRQFLNPDIKYREVFRKPIRGNRLFFRLFSPKSLYHYCVKDSYDIVVSYLEGITARIVSGCDDIKTKLVSWIHVEQHTMDELSSSFQNEKEARECYNRFDQTVCVSQFVYDDFCRILNFQRPCRVLYNTVESDKILIEASEAVTDIAEDGKIHLIAVATLKPSKGYMRLLKIIKRLRDEQYPVKLYILGIGPLQKEMEEYIRQNNLGETVTMLGYQTNPYKYMAKCDLFVCASFAEGFSTAATEALIVGTPVCTVNVSGMREMLGEHDEYGIVTENSESGLYEGIKRMIDSEKVLADYHERAKERGQAFNTESTIKAVEEMLEGL